MKKVIHWFRRDLRLTDNTALAAADQQAECVIPVFILDGALQTGPDVGAARLAFLLESVRSLQEELRQSGYSLVVRSGQPEELLPALCRKTGAQAVFCNRRYEPYAQAREGRVFNALNAAGFGFAVFKDAVVWEDAEIVTSKGEPYTVFTPYARAWKARTVPAPKRALGTARGPSPAVPSEPLPSDTAAFGHPLRQSLPSVGAGAAMDLWQDFQRRKLRWYATSRDFPALEGTSALSPHLRCGTIGIRSILQDLREARARLDQPGRESCDRFLAELIWREFFLQILSNFPQVAGGPFREEYAQVAWSTNLEHFERWCAGQTGYPIVDAAMRCLKATGWMHNRLRMIVAMFLIKDLLIDWRRGERYFMQQLVDGDLAANNGGWQWCAGTGTDAAPYFRIFNPVTQSRRFDPDGLFIRKWVAELEPMPAEFIHEPWKSPLLSRGGYPEPIVRHEEQRTKFLAMFRNQRR